MPWQSRCGGILRLSSFAGSRRHRSTPTRAVGFCLWRQRYESAYLFGAICPAGGTGAALALPYADTHAMQLHLDEIGKTVAKGAHAALLLDRAGWHTTASSID